MNERMNKHISHKGTLAFMQRFLSKVDIGAPSECWNYEGSKHRQGYGMFRTCSTVMVAHRIAYQLSNPNEDISGKVIMHSCDNPSCCNPKHLTCGTQADNMRDRDLKNRNAKGERHGRSKLTRRQVEQMRAEHKAGKSIKQVASDYNTCDSNAYAVCNYLTWKHLTVAS